VARKRHRLKLGKGKGTPFVKTHLKELPQQKDTWEADIRLLPRSAREGETQHYGLAIALPRGDYRANMLVEYPPDVNDLADLLGAAMRGPITGSPHRPAHLRLRRDPRWEELLPHLKSIGIETSIHDELPLLEEVLIDFLRQVRRAGPRPLIMMSPGPGHIDEQFPALAQWVQDGHIEIGDQEGFGFVVRALDYGRQVFEDNRPRTLVEAMLALEKGLREWFEEQGIELQQPS
jgi:hypothetical protein